MSGGNDTIQQQSGPPAYAAPYHLNALQFGAEAAAQPYQPYMGPRIAGFTPSQQWGLNAMEQRGMAGSPVNQAAQNQATQTLNGDYLNPATNLGLQNLLDYQTKNVMTNYGGALGRNFGNSGVTEAVGNAIGQATAPLYNDERNRQMSAMGMAPSLAGTDYQDIQSVLGAGDARQSQQQKMLDVPYQEFMTAQQWPSYQMGLLSQSLGAGSVGNQSSQSNPYQTNPAQNALGFGTLGYMAAPEMGVNPWLGAAGGAGLGLLLS